MAGFATTPRRCVDMSRVSEANPTGEFWPVVFVSGCNLRCPYCLNTKVVEPASNQSLQLADILSKLEDWDEPGVMISGGEFLMDGFDFENISLIKALAAGGRKIGISTNGMSPSQLKDFLHMPEVAFVALDCKFGLTNPEDIAKIKANLIGLTSADQAVSSIKSSLECLFNWHESNPAAQSEVRMTMYPPLISLHDVDSVACLVHKNSKLVLQHYRKNKMFNGDVNPVEPMDDQEVNRIMALVEDKYGIQTEGRWP
jgi:pyruvate formate lyase activating enzyme